MNFRNTNSSLSRCIIAQHLTDIKHIYKRPSVFVYLKAWKNSFGLVVFFECCCLFFRSWRLKQFQVIYLVFISCFIFPFTANADANFSARLSPLPLTLRTVDTITGGGSVEAMLVGSQLSITGRFHGLSGLATEARVHMGQLAIPGEAIAELTVSLKKSGELSGRLELSSEQITRLYAHGIYIQIYSDVAVEGNLRGWLIITEGENND